LPSARHAGAIRVRKVRRPADGTRRNPGGYQPITLFALSAWGWRDAGEDAQAAELIVAVSLAVDIGVAQPLETGLALVVASGRGAQLGIFIKGYQALESSRGIDTVVLDKTGTVTTGQMTVTAVRAVPGTSRADLLRHAGPVEQASEHAVAAAITALARAEAPS
jgi:P-type E1-E2 ATPase